MDTFLQPGRKIIFCLLLLISLCALTLSVASAQFTTSKEIMKVARTAHFSVSTKMVGACQLVLNSEEIKSVDFTISNRDGNASEVSIEYDVVVTLPATLDSLGLKMALYCNDEPRVEEVETRFDDYVVYSFPRVGKFDAGKGATDHCRLCFKLSDPEISGDFRLIIDVYARQVL